MLSQVPMPDGSSGTSLREERHGTRYSALAAGCADSNHNSACLALALTQARKMATLSDRVAIREGVNSESSFSAVSWAAVIGGAFTSVAISMLLLTLGSGLGLSSVSPWAG